MAGLDDNLTVSLVWRVLVGREVRREIRGGSAARDGELMCRLYRAVLRHDALVETLGALLGRTERLDAGPAGVVGLSLGGRGWGTSRATAETGNAWRRPHRFSTLTQGPNEDGEGRLLCRLGRRCPQEKTAPPRRNRAQRAPWSSAPRPVSRIRLRCPPG